MASDNDFIELADQFADDLLIPYQYNRLALVLFILGILILAGIILLF